MPHFERVTLETSLKPWVRNGVMDPPTLAKVSDQLWRNWSKLCERADEVCVLLWVGDGSEIFHWHGDDEGTFPYAHSVGFCNYKTLEAFPPENRHYRVNAAIPFMDNPPDLTFGDLRDIIASLRTKARDVIGKEILIGATIDPGPEFVENDWKFTGHPEILVPDGPRRFPRMMRFLTHQAHFHADHHEYAAFPEGLPEATPLGTFLGRQFTHMMPNLGYDYIWFSNGFAYTHCPWGWQGELIDLEGFHPQRANEQRRLCNAFWEDFRAACPDAGIEVRGTNFTVGMDLASDGCSHVDIAAIGKLQRGPCNPPWGSRALGLEMCSYLSRIAKTPTERLPFRFYLNDPWFNSTPWEDYYGREPFDLYVPMSASRLNADGGVSVPSDLSLLTIDSELGELSTDQANESTPHMIRAMEERADAAGPVVWVYPFDEWDALLKEDPGKLNWLIMQEWFMCHAVNAGLPVSTVCSSDVFEALQRSGTLPDAVYIAPTPVKEGWPYAAALLAHAQNGGKVMLYGPLDDVPNALLDALSINLGPALDGDFELDVRLKMDAFAEEPVRPVSGDAFEASIGHAVKDSGATRDRSEGPRPLRHHARIDAGGLCAVARDDAVLRVSARQDGEARAYAVLARTAGAGQLAWIRGSVCFDPDSDSLEPVLDPAWEVTRPDDFPRRLLAEMGLDILQDRTSTVARAANLFVKRRRGDWVFTGHKPDTTTRVRVKTEHGAPCFAECDTPIRDGYAIDTCFGKTINSCVNAFVQMPDGVVTAKEMPARHIIGQTRHLSLSGLTDATVTVFIDPAVMAGGTYDLHAVITDDKQVPHVVDQRRATLVVRGYTGTLYVSW